MHTSLLFNFSIRFQKLLAFPLTLSIMFLVGCADPAEDTSADQYNIGDKLTSLSDVKMDSESNQIVTVFDEVLRRIHQFDTNRMVKLRTIKVPEPNQNHFVLASADGNYIIDFGSTVVSIFDSQGTRQYESLRMPTQPRSAAFDSRRGLLVVYDEKMNVGLMKISPSGRMVDSTVLGPMIGPSTIVSGEIMSNGQLVLALSDSSLAVVNVNQSLDDSKWSYKVVPTELGEISWIAPIQDNEKTIFAYTPFGQGYKYAGGSVSIINLENGKVLRQQKLVGDVIKLSKRSNGHIITSNEYSRTIYYAKNNDIVSSKMYKQSGSILNSHLDLKSDTWSIYDSNRTAHFELFGGGLNWIRSGRKFRSVRITDLKTSKVHNIPNEAQIIPAENYYFSLYKSDLGYATKTNFSDETVITLKGFNIKEFDR